mgnify:CR=1 FL=1
MKKLKDGDYVRVYHEVDDNGEHWYWFCDGNKTVYLDWGETGLVPNWNDRFSHPERNIELRLEGVVSSASYSSPL